MPVHEYFLKEELVLDSVTSGHKNVKETLLSVVYEHISDLCVPLLEFVASHVDALLVDVNAGVEVGRILRDLLFEMHGKFGTVIIVDVGTERPND